MDELAGVLANIERNYAAIDSSGVRRITVGREGTRRIKVECIGDPWIQEQISSITGQPCAAHGADI